MMEVLFGADNILLSEPLNLLALVNKKQNNYEISKDMYERAIHLAEKTFGAEHYRVAKLCTLLADISRKLDDYASAGKQHFNEKWKLKLEQRYNI
jgi:hypothetical protein